MITDTPPPRRKWHLQRWLLLLSAGFLAYGGWTQYAFRAALKEARALGWVVAYTDPVEEIGKSWKAAFKKETWLDGVTHVNVPTSEAFEQHLTIIHRLNTKGLIVNKAATLGDLSALKPLSRLQSVCLTGCKGLTNVDALKNLGHLQTIRLSGGTRLTNVDALKDLPALQIVDLTFCTGLPNLDGLKNLPALKTVWLEGCTGLTKESVASLKAALPNTEILGP